MSTALDDEKSSTDSPIVLEAGHELPAKRTFYRSVMFQMIIVGMSAFCTTGVFGSILSIGGGGQAAPWVWNTTTSAVFAIMTVTCILGGPVANRLGLKWTVMIGAAGYCPYIASLYVNSRYGTTWFMIFGSILCGIGAGLFFAAEGAIVMGYPEKRLLGRYLSIWVTFRTLGGIVGASISLSLNINSDGSGSVGNSTYIGLTAISACAAPFIIFLSPPDKVQREDRTPIPFAPKRSLGSELKALGRAMINKRVLMLLPSFWMSYFGFTYSGNFQTLYFSVRSRALAGFLNQWAAILGSLILGLVLDRTSISRSSRAKLGFAVTTALGIATWVWAAVLQADYDKSAPLLDWTDHGFARGFVWLLFWNLWVQSIQNLLYWLIPAFNYDIQSVAIEAGILRGFEAAGEALAFGVGSVETSMWVSLGLNIGFFAVSVVPLWLVIRVVPDEDETTEAPELKHELAMGTRD